MGRLIDVDALIERIKEHQKNVGSVAGGVAGELYKVAHEHFIDIVNNQPTAYDVNNVAKEECKDSEEPCIVTVKISKEDLWELVDYKAKKIELDIQAIRNKAIDEFVERVKEVYPFTILELEQLDEIAEQLKAGGIDE